jgi:hypothetical protein
MRISVPHTGPAGGTYHTHHTISTGPPIPGGLVLAALLLLPGAVIWQAIRGPTWDRDNRAAARASYQKMNVEASLKRTPIGKPNPIEPDRRVWSYVATIKITNSDSKPHLVSACVPPDSKKQTLHHHSCMGSLPQLPQRAAYDDTDKFANCIPAHTTVTWRWRERSEVPNGSSWYGKPYISAVDGVSLDDLSVDHTDWPADQVQSLNKLCDRMPNTRGLRGRN